MSRDPVQRTLHRTLALLPVGWGVLVAVLAAWGRVGGLMAALLAGVGIGAGVLLLLGWERRRRTRVEVTTLADTRAMLQDRLPDHIHLLLRAATAPDREMNARERARLAEVVNAAREVEAALELLTPGSLEAWRRRQAGGSTPPSAPPNPKPRREGS